MQKIISRCVLIQKNFMSRCSRVQQYQVILYNEMPLSSSSLFRCFDKDKNKKLYQQTEVNGITNNPEALFQSDGNYLNLYTHSIIFNDKQTHATKLNILHWFAKSDDSERKDPGLPGTRIGRLDAAHEAGFFHRADKSKLKQIKKKLKNKGDDSKATEPKKPT